MKAVIEINCPSFGKGADSFSNCPSCKFLKECRLETQKQDNNVPEPKEQASPDPPKEQAKSKSSFLDSWEQPVEFHSKGKEKHFLVQPSTGEISPMYYVKKKPLFGKHDGYVKWGIIFLCIPLVCMNGSKADFNAENYIMFTAFLAIILFFFWLVFSGAKKVTETKIFQKKHYEHSKRWVAVVKANGMMVPAPFTKESYYRAEDYVQWYENAYPEEYEPYRVWITPEEMAGFIAECRSKGRKQVY